MKIKHSTLNKILQECTSKEIDFILYIAQFQDDLGVVKGVNYKDLCNDIDIAQSTFFHVVSSLEQKEIITINYLNNDYSFWTITINDNAFPTVESFKDGYLNINRAVLHSKEFYKLTRGEKVILLNVLKIANERYKIKVTLQTLMKWTSYKKQAVIRSMKKLSKLFDIERNKNTFAFIYNLKLSATTGVEKTIYNKHKVRYISKKHKILTDDANITDVANLFNQYHKIAPQIIYDVIEMSLNALKELNPRYIHKHLRNHLDYLAFN